GAALTPPGTAISPPARGGFGTRPVMPAAETDTGNDPGRKPRAAAAINRRQRSRWNSHQSGKRSPPLPGGSPGPSIGGSTGGGHGPPRSPGRPGPLGGNTGPPGQI